MARFVSVAPPRTVRVVEPEDHVGEAQVRQGDTGRVLVFYLQTGDGGFYEVAEDCTVALRAVERGDAPVRERRPPRSFDGDMVVDAEVPYRVTYACAAADVAHVGVFDAVIVVTTPGEEEDDDPTVETWPTSSAPPAGLVIRVTAPPGA